mgnify:CR=1 FL=1
MKKLTTALLCLLMVFSCAFCVNANDVPWESNQDDKTVSVTAYQDENGDVVFEVSGDDATEFIEKILMCNDEAGNSIGYMDFEQKGITARLGNIIDKDHIVRSNEGLTIKKEILEDVGFYNDDCTFTLLAKGFVPVKVENVVISNIKEKNQRLPLLKSELKLEGEVGDVKFGEPVYLKGDNGEYIANHTENLRITDKNGNELDKSLYTLRWARRIVDYADKYGFQDPLDIFSDLCLRDKNNSLLVSTISYDYQNKTYDYSAKFTEGEKYALYVVYQGEYEADNRFSISVSYKDNIYSVRDGIIELHSRHYGINDFSYIDAYSIVIDSIKLEGEKEVAMVGDKTYASLQEAINVAKKGEEVVLINDVKEHINVKENTDVVLNMNGKTIDSDTSDRPTFYINSGARVDFQGEGYIYNNTTNTIFVNFGSCRIKGPTVFGTMGKDGKTNVIWNKGLFLVESGKITASDTLTPYIYGMNEFVVTGGELGNGKLLIEEHDTHTFKLSGGTYNCSEEDLVNFLADGYCLTKDSNGLITIVKANETTVKEPTLVANKDNLDSVKDTKGLEDIISVGIKLENKKTEELKAEQKKELDTFIKENVNTDVEHHIICLDLKLVGAKNDGTKVNEITEVLAKPLTVTVALSDADVNNLNGKTIKVIRYHTNDDGTIETTYLDATLEGNILTFKTDRFSTYVVVGYRQAGGATPTPSPTPTAKPTASNTSKAGPKDLNADGVITCDEEMGSANWIWSESKKACVYKVSNTSVK